MTVHPNPQAVARPGQPSPKRPVPDYPRSATQIEREFPEELAGIRKDAGNLREGIDRIEATCGPDHLNPLIAGGCPF